MVKKLFKHEFAYYLRSLLIFLPILLVMAIIIRVLLIFYSSNIGYVISLYSSLILFYIGSIAAIIMTFVVSIVRFYKNIYSSEGYLTLSLPVTYHEHILVKLSTSVCCYLASGLIVIVSWLLVLSGIPGAYEGIESVLNQVFGPINKVHLVFYIIEVAILGLIGLIYNHLVYYCCISLGQTSKKNRIFSSIGAYFLYTIILQTIGTGVTILLTNLASTGALNWLGVFVRDNPYTFVHLLILLSFIVIGVIGFVLYKTIIDTMKKKLNLE